MKTLKYSLAVTFIILSLNTQAQDHSFSQFNLAPLHLNPALTGSTQAKARIITNYIKHKNFNSSSLAALSVDGRKILSDSSYIGWGITGFKDKIEVIAWKNKSKSGLISLSYGRRLGKDINKVHFLTIGSQIGISKMNIDPPLALSPFLLDDEDNNADFNLNDINIQNQSPNNSYLDLNMGLLWMCKMDTHSSFYLGLAAHHINKPKVSLQRIGHQDSINQSVIKTTLHGGGEIVIHKTWTLAPSIMFRNQSGRSALTLGTYFRKYRKANPSNNFIQAGLFVQDIGDSTPSSFVFATSLKIKKALIGISISKHLEGLSKSYPNGIIYELTASYSIGHLDNATQLPSMY